LLSVNSFCSFVVLFVSKWDNFAGSLFPKERVNQENIEEEFVFLPV
jgi:hypothetical protein